MDLVAMINNARTEDEIATVMRISRARTRARRAEMRQGFKPQGFKPRRRLRGDRAAS